MIQVLKNQPLEYLITVLLLVDDLDGIPLNWKGTDSWAMDLSRDNINKLGMGFNILPSSVPVNLTLIQLIGLR